MDEQADQCRAHSLPECQGGRPAAGRLVSPWRPAQEEPGFGHSCRISESWSVGHSCVSALTGHLEAPHTSQTHMALGFTPLWPCFQGGLQPPGWSAWLPWVPVAASQSGAGGLCWFGAISSAPAVLGPRKEPPDVRREDRRVFPDTSSVESTQLVTFPRGFHGCP